MTLLEEACKPCQAISRYQLTSCYVLGWAIHCSPCRAKLALEKHSKPLAYAVCELFADINGVLSEQNFDYMITHERRFRESR